MRRYAKNLKRTPVAMSKELRAFVQILVAEEHSISQNNGVQADEIISVTGPEVSAESLKGRSGDVNKPLRSCLQPAKSPLFQIFWLKIRRTRTVQPKRVP